jgi:hypothetical protein
MRLCLLIVCVPTLLFAAPVAGLAPTPEHHLEAAGTIRLSADAAGLSGMGRLGFSPTVDAGLMLGLRAGDITGLTIGIPSRVQWLSQLNTGGWARITSDFWFSVTQASPELLTELSATASATHSRKIMGASFPTEFRLTSGALLSVHDKTDLKDSADLGPIILGGLGLYLIEGWSCSLEGGFSGGSGLINLEASFQF